MFGHLLLYPLCLQVLITQLSRMAGFSQKVAAETLISYYSDFNWSCSTGRFADMDMSQTISIVMLNESDSGEFFCSLCLIWPPI